MKRRVRFACLLLSLLLLAGCANTDSTAASDLSGAALAKSGAKKTERALSEIRQLGESPDDNYRTYYEIFVYSFCDSDGDGIGDLQGVISKLDYLTQLGINGIWLMPIHPSTSYHKYNVSDYYAIDPDYGTLEDFDALIAACDERGINVIIDLVVNHTGSEHQWFKDAVSYLQGLEEGAEPDANQCKYLDYYFFSKEAGNGMRTVEGTQWFYEGVFDYAMPDLNLASPAVREEISQIMSFWIDRGVSGFRIDAAKEFYTGRTSMNVEVLSWLQQTATQLDPNCYMVAEVWDSFGTITDYYESGITSIFNYPFGNNDGKIVKVLQGAGNFSVVSTYAPALEKADNAYRGSNPDYIDAPFLSNHDVGRVAGFVSRDENKIKLAGAMNIFMSGSVFIYYGEEIGMTGSGNDPSKRAPMYWNADRDDGTTNPPPECELPEEYPLGSVEEQIDKDGSVLSYYRQAIAIRNALPVISHGTTTTVVELNSGCIAAMRKEWNGEECIILMNIDSSAAEVDLSFYEDWHLAASLSADGGKISLKNGTLKLAAYGVAILLPGE